jgi:hypothetical protein
VESVHNLIGFLTDGTIEKASALSKSKLGHYIVAVVYYELINTDRLSRNKSDLSQKAIGKGLQLRAVGEEYGLDISVAGFPRRV